MTSIPNSFLYAGLFFFCVFITSAFATYKFGREWKNNEFARRVMGVAIVMGLALILVAAEELSITAWLVLVAGFAIAGAVNGYRQLNDTNSEQDDDTTRAMIEFEQVDNEQI